MYDLQSISSCLDNLLHSCSPFESTNLSLLNQSGVCGAYFIVYFQSATPNAAMPIAPPGCPKIISTRSIVRHVVIATHAKLLTKISNQEPEALEHQL